MAENKKSFLLYADFYHTFNELSDEEAGQLIKHLLAYVNDLNPETNNRLIKIAFEPIKHQLKRDLKKWDDIKNKRSLAGKSSVEAKKRRKKEKLTNLTSVEFDQQNQQGSTNSTVNVNVNVINRILFADFWDMYDKKVGDKEKLTKKWDQLSTKDQNLIMEHLPKYKLAEPNKKYRKNPSTYLNAKAWRDEIIEQDQMTTAPRRIGYIGY